MAKAQIGMNGLDRNPHRFGKRGKKYDCWYYEEPGGVSVFHETLGFLGVISKRSIRAYTKRLDALQVKAPFASR